MPQNYAKARQWFEKAAAQGNSLAQTSLGMLYELGNDVPQNFVQARQWYEKAATQGNWAAQFYLGVLYAKGQGVPQDAARAYMWFNLVATDSTDSIGYFQKLSTDTRDAIARRMSPAQIAEAQQLSQQCQAQQFKDC